MVDPTNTATALHSPSRRGRRSPQRSVGDGGDGGDGGGGDDGVDMSGPNIHFRTHDATLRAARPARGHLHLPPHHPRRHRPHHRLGARVRRALAASNGRLLPPLDLPTVIEYGHRLAALAVSMLVAALAAYAWWLRRETGIGKRETCPGQAAYVALALLTLQIALGAVT